MHAIRRSREAVTGLKTGTPLAELDRPEPQPPKPRLRPEPDPVILAILQSAPEPEPPVIEPEPEPMEPRGSKPTPIPPGTWKGLEIFTCAYCGHRYAPSDGRMRRWSGEVACRKCFDANRDEAALSR